MIKAYGAFTKGLRYFFIYISKYMRLNNCVNNLLYLFLYYVMYKMCFLLNIIIRYKVDFIARMKDEVDSECEVGLQVDSQTVVLSRLSRVLSRLTQSTEKP